MRMIQPMEELVARANRTILETHWLRQEGRSLRREAAVLAGKLGETIMRGYKAAEKTPGFLPTDPTSPEVRRLESRNPGV